jgi:hypothetical protein
MSDREPFDPEQFSRLVADSPAQIRKQDVYRLFDECDSSDWPALYQWLIRERSDLRGEANTVWEELGGVPC